jgi:hypothetical protein
MERVNFIVNEVGRDLTKDEAQLIEHLTGIETNKTNQADVFDRLFKFLMEQ